MHQRHYWLMKSEPSTWSWDNQVKAGEVGTGWDGVRNYQASNNMKAMKLGDQAFFYHSVDEKSVVGIVEICGLYEPDPSDEMGRFGMVRVKAVKAFVTPVSLAMVKTNPLLAGMALLRQSRLSVQPVSLEEWQEICRLGGVTVP